MLVAERIGHRIGGDREEECCDRGRKSNLVSGKISTMQYVYNLFAPWYLDDDSVQAGMKGSWGGRKCCDWATPDPEFCD
jgi:hypothetical protein